MMAANPPAKCCTQGVKFTGEPLGSFIDIDGIDTYITGTPGDNVLFFLSDVLGNKFINTQLVADSYAARGYFVVVPDLYENDPTKLNEGLPDGWLDRHNPTRVEEIVRKALKYVKETYKPKFLACMGYCYGACFTIRLLGDSSVDVGACAHPSLVTIEEIGQIEKPIIIMAAENDEIFADELRLATEKKLFEIGAQYHMTLSSGVKHGFAVRGDPNDYWNNVAKSKAFEDSLWWFKLFNKQN